MFSLFGKPPVERNRESVRRLERFLLEAKRNEAAVAAEIRQLENQAIDSAKSGQNHRVQSLARSIQRLTRSQQATGRRHDKLRDWVMAAKLSRDDRELASVLGEVAGQMKLKVNRLPKAVADLSEALDGLEAQEDVWRDAEELDNASAESVPGVPSVESIVDDIVKRASVGVGTGVGVGVGVGVGGNAVDETAVLRERANKFLAGQKENQL